MIRTVDISDAKGITEIYNEYILSSKCTFETDPLSHEEIASRIKNVNQEYPWLVYTENDSVLGYTYASKWKERSAYHHTVEIGIYIHSGNLHKGIGTILIKELIEHLKDQSVHSVVCGIALPNPPSVVLFENFGFKKVAHFHEVGRKFDEWIDVGYWQLIL